MNKLLIVLILIIGLFGCNQVENNKNDLNKLENDCSTNTLIIHYLQSKGYYTYSSRIGEVLINDTLNKKIIIIENTNLSSCKEIEKNMIDVFYYKTQR